MSDIVFIGIKRSSRFNIKNETPFQEKFIGQFSQLKIIMRVILLNKLEES